MATTTNEKVRAHPASPQRLGGRLGGADLNSACPHRTWSRILAPGEDFMTAKSGHIRLGIDGWTFEPWRGTCYPKGLPHAKELPYAAERLTSIELNGTFYRTQKPTVFRKWASEVPDGFVFSIQAIQYATNRRILKEAGYSIQRFLGSGVTELGSRLGPILWQFAPTKKFDEADFGGFLELLPETFDGHTLRHVIEVRHDSFKTPQFIAMLR